MMLLLKVFGTLVLLFVCAIAANVAAEAARSWFHSRPWDPPTAGPSCPAADMAAIYRRVLRANRCKVTRLESSNIETALEPYQAALGEMLSESCSNSTSPIAFHDGGNRAEVYFARVQGPLNGKGGTYALSRRKSGEWGIDGPVGMFWVS